MPTGEVMSMIGQALRAMAIGVPAVFLVQCIFYVVLRLLMSRTSSED